MNTILLSIPAFLASLMLAAHFYRAQLVPAVVVSLVIPLLLFVRRNWAVRIVQLLLMIGALEWLRAMFGFIGERQSEGRPWTRLAVILIGVEAFTVLAAILLNKRLRTR